MADDGYYRDVDCLNCGRHRVQTDGVCEKCLWDSDADAYAPFSRPTEYDANGRIYNPPDNDPFGEAPALPENDL